MKAALIESVNHLAIVEAPRPQLEEGEALIKVKYIGICGTDVHVLRGHHPTAKYPLIPGHEFVGEVVEVKGKGAERFSMGDLVVAQEVVSCGVCDACAKGEDNVCKELQIVGVHTNGGFAEYVKVMTKKMYKIPPDTDIQLAALTEPLAVAVHDVRMSGLKAGETAFVIGGGPIGMLLAIVARHSGARKVMISEVSEFRRDFASKMGFDVINPMEDGFDEKLDAYTEGRGFDVSFEAAGAKNALNTCLDHTKQTGTVMVIAMTNGHTPVDTGKIFAKELRVQGVRIHSQYNFVGAVDIITSGAITGDLMKLVSKVYPLDEVAAAFDHAENNKEGFKVLVKVSD